MSGGLYLAYAALGAMAIIPIYLGSNESIPLLKGPASKKIKKSFPEYSDSDDSEDEIETVSSQDAYMFPVYGSVALFSLYLVLKYLNKDYVNLLLAAYFALAGIAAMTEAGSIIVKKVTKIKLPLYHLSLTHKMKEVFLLKFTNIHLGALLGSVVLTGVYMYTKNWILSNTIGFAFSFTAIKLMKLDSIKSGIIMLAGLFFYDIFWVFGTEVMVSVAKNLDAPIKFVFPKQLILNNASEKLNFVMLGLGDVVIPGVFIALCLRFDQNQYLKKIGYVPRTQLPSALKGKKRGFFFDKPYFTTCFIAYFLGLVTTVYVMHTFKAAQPALLYLSPACSLSVVILAVVRGELSDLFSYSEEVADEDTKKKPISKPSDQINGIKKQLNNTSTSPLTQTPSILLSSSNISTGELADDELDSHQETQKEDTKSEKIPTSLPGKLRDSNLYGVLPGFNEQAEAPPVFTFIPKEKLKPINNFSAKEPLNNNPKTKNKQTAIKNMVMRTARVTPLERIKQKKKSQEKPTASTLYSIQQEREKAIENYRILKSKSISSSFPL
ncbi:hypothetical protein BB559_003451 [Furculomyces boomerangus]|uniref:Minor histocompatibility antigen H13 n=1 Tax=Furculomyces boomerangus TaxID=61424 RepID=A0A2T9YLD4_9FUNG|nr:hypothetical protein BB559_003451 [Furculomyces boomerangus]